eukprot:maker-scaffold68_size422247-snap-gene-0.15 protein:Tk11384 transcript:maker-scaffold68_size422247-snap-gene-0.15-mRNA-1 annotation:"cathepsin l-like"
MKLYIILGLAISATLAREIPDEGNLDETFEEFQSDFHDIVLDPEEAKKRAETLKDSEKAIKNHNQEFKDGKSSYYMKLNELSDLPLDEEVHQKFGLINVEGEDEFARGAFPLPLSSFDRASEDHLAQVRTGSPAPSSYMTSSSYLTLPKNQQQCGSCAAFATTAAVETCMLKNGALLADLDLSEQSLVDCGYQWQNQANGCNGATIGAYTNFLSDNLDGQLPHELNDPYKNTSPRLSCPNVARYNTGAKVVDKIVSYGCDEATMEQLVAQHGMVITSLYAGNNDNVATAFTNYGGGIYDGCPTSKSARSNVNHAVTVVGYGTEGGVKYWKVRNSWGANWGANGYMKIKRGVNMCAIGHECTVPICGQSSGPLSAPPPPPPPPPPSATCDVSSRYPGLTGRYNWTSGGVTTLVSCTNAICRLDQGTSEQMCLVLCGKIGTTCFA